MQVGTQNIINDVKKIVHQYDPLATVILFGSRARGDYEEESDWDFLILTEKNEKQQLLQLEKQIRNDIFEQIEMVSFDVVQTIVRNKKIWEEELYITPLYETIKEEGRQV